MRMQEQDEHHEHDEAGGAGVPPLMVVRGGGARGPRRTRWRKSAARRSIDLELADDFLTMPGGCSRPSLWWNDQARRPELYAPWGHLVFRLDEAIDAGYELARVARPVLRLLLHVVGRCLARDPRPIVGARGGAPLLRLASGGLTVSVEFAEPTPVADRRRAA